MNELFKDQQNFNDDISGWNVSGVTDMNDMFAGASPFNQGLSNWKRLWSDAYNYNLVRLRTPFYIDR